MLADTSETTITPAAIDTATSCARYASTVIGNISAAASETAPRTPANAVAVTKRSDTRATGFPGRRWRYTVIRSVTHTQSHRRAKSPNETASTAFASSDQDSTCGATRAIVGSLRSLTVTGRDLRTITLGALPKLEALTIHDAKLSALDVARCPRLTKLDLSRCGLGALPALPPRIEELLVADNPLRRISLRSKTLRKLDVTRCGLDALDLSKLEGLVRLDCAFNTIRTLDLRALARLEILWCQGNGADVKLPPRAPLSVLVTSGNPRRELDASAYPKLETLFVDGAGLATLVLGNAALEHLEIEDNALATLDLAAAPALRHLNASGNALGPIDVRPLTKLDDLEVDATVEVLCTELQKHVLPQLRERFGLPKPTKTIAKMDAYQLHAFVDGYNWDDGPKKLAEAIRQPACGLATALLVYWQSQPQDYTRFAKAKDAPKAERAWVELLREIEAGVAKQRFPRGPVAFDVHDVRGVDISDDDPAIPARMREPVTIVASSSR